MTNTQAKKILCIVQLPPPIHGASVMNNYVINSELIRRNFIINVVNLKFVKSLKEISNFSFLKVFKAIIIGFEIINKLLMQRPDLVYFTLSPTGYAFFRDAFYVLLIKIFNIKIVFHLHGKGIRESIEYNNLRKGLYKLVFKNTDVICLSKILTSDIENLCEYTPYIVPNGIQVYPKKNVKIHKTKNSITNILFLSNFKRDKGIVILIEALGILKNQGFTFNARLVGGTSDVTNEFLENLIQCKNLTEYVKVVGPLYSDDKVAEFRKADIFVFPTFYKNEAFPLVILEAYQFAIPVISTFEGGIPDIVINNETGFLVKTQNPQMLAEKIAILLNNNNLRRMMGKKGYERFINNYTLEHFENNLNRTFQTILGNY